MLKHSLLEQLVELVHHVLQVLRPGVANALHRLGGAQVVLLQLVQDLLHHAHLLLQLFGSQQQQKIRKKKVIRVKSDPQTKAKQKKSRVFLFFFRGGFCKSARA